MAEIGQITTNTEPSLNRLLLSSYRFAKASRHMDSILRTPTRLTRREREILALMALNLSTNEIAERLVVSIQTVRWYIKELYSKLDVHSRDEAVAKIEALLQGAAPPAPPALTHSLPARMTTFIGRNQELTTLRSILLHAETRLLTLVGTAGMGKTRLSIEVAYSLLDAFPDGVTFIALASLNDPALVAETTAQALGVHESNPDAIIAALKNNLRSKHALLIFDNFEHVLDAAPLIADLISAAPHLKVLATSREPLNLYSERQFLISSLSLPDDAIKLFDQRAKTVDPTFLLTPENTEIVSQICAELDGIPLAIELAAARIRLFPLPMLLSRLNHRLSLLTGGARDLAERHRTLRDAINWSYQLLSEDEKWLFRRLGVFAGGWAPEALEAIGSPELTQDIYEIFDSLIAKSLIKLAANSNEEPRFIMLETLREFALEQLITAGELDSVQALHAAYFLKMAQTVLQLGFDQHSIDYLHSLNVELENFRLALDYLHTTDGAAEQEMAMIGALGRFWWERGHMNDMLTRTQAAIARDREAFALDIRAGAYAMLSFAHGGFYQNELAIQSAEIALTLAKQAGSPYWTARALVALIACNPLPGGNERRLQLAKEALALLPQLDHPSTEIPILESYIFALEAAGEMEQAAKMYDRILMLAKRHNDYRILNFLLQRRVIELRNLQDYEGSYAAAVEGLETARRSEDKRIILSFLRLHADAAVKAERLNDARQSTNELLKLAAHMNILAELSNAYQTDCFVAHKEGNIAQARTALRMALESSKEVDLLDFRLGSLLRFAEAFINLGDFETAARLYGAAGQLCQKHRVDRSLVFSAYTDTMMEAVKAAIEAERFNCLHEEGAAMSAEAAWALALERVEHL